MPKAPARSVSASVAYEAKVISGYLAAAPPPHQSRVT
jgi:hypothetical protein